jgi:YHS domain-containing protein
MEPKQDPGIQSACGGVLTDPETYPSADYHGKRVYFCTRACLRAFEENPDGFMNGEVEHPLGDD